MVTDQQVRKPLRPVKTEESLAVAAANAGMCEKAARPHPPRAAHRQKDVLHLLPTGEWKAEPREAWWGGHTDTGHGPGQREVSTG